MLIHSFNKPQKVADKVFQVQKFGFLTEKLNTSIYALYICQTRHNFRRYGFNAGLIGELIIINSWLIISETIFPCEQVKINFKLKINKGTHYRLLY